MLLLLQSYVTFTVLLIRTAAVCSSQDSNNYENNGINEENFGSLYMFSQSPNYPRDCSEARNRCSTSDVSGIYYIKPVGYPEPFEVYCDNTIGSGGWTVINRFQDGSLLFNRTWSEYKSGFGFLYQDFWIGNEKLSFLTNQNSYELRIALTSADGLYFYVTYNNFRISDEHSEYRLISVGEYNGADEKIDMFLCPPSKEGALYVSPDCSQQCSCISGQFVCDDTYHCSPNAVCEERNGVLQCYCRAGYTGDGMHCSPVLDCQDVYERVSHDSNVYQIKPTAWQGEPFDVYCNMTDGGGWTVFQRRMDGSQDFFLNWADYKAGFGTPDREVWLGNDKLHSLTTQKSYEFRVDVIDSLGDPYYAKYSTFSVSDESNNYRLSVGMYLEGTAGDKLSYNNGQAFTTRDRENDRSINQNCAIKEAIPPCGRCNNNAAWWYNADPCSYLHLNGPYGNICFRWDGLSAGSCDITYTEMKVRPI
ncbi:Ryncolin-1 [Holothuria leucospilota]|uniref:Ryncolin-1 n=1 Tax=Holothuria leucospilota TaxID=206669 RepID=A0A9Q1BVH1_HOLLE|nr:Ryncolin-1 [Holothuria leucospilota]